MVRISPLDAKPKSFPPRVEILGLFGSGKSTLLQKLDVNRVVYALPEAHERIAAWGNDSFNEQLGFLPYDVAFLLQHVELAAASSMSALINLCDWSFVTDNLWARRRLNSADYTVYKSLADAILARINTCAGYIYLRAEPETILLRLKHRARTAEASITLAEITEAVFELDSVVSRAKEMNIFTVCAERQLNEILPKAISWLKKL